MPRQSGVKISVVTPTYREAENLPSLVAGIAAALSEFDYEIVVADDDSPDDTRAVCERLGREYPLRLLTRKTDRGLSPAVIDGIGVARGDIVVVMDADLSHPPEAAARMARMIEAGEADFVIGSRYAAGGSVAHDWPWLRRLNSRIATWAALPLCGVKDPMSGFFALRRRDMPPPESLSPLGYKIGLEILVKGGFARAAETPIHFSDRERGESKMTVAEQILYLRHLRRLYHHRWPKPTEFLQFCAVGVVGLVVDVACYLALVAAGMPHVWARAAAYWPAVTSNWFWNRNMTFKTRAHKKPRRQWAEYALASSAGFAVNWGTYAFLTAGLRVADWQIGGFDFFDSRRLLALFIGVVVATFFNFGVSDLWVFRQARD